jgi:hypothetical protein
VKPSNTEMHKNPTSQREASRTRSQLETKVKDPSGLLKSTKSPFARVIASLIFCVALIPGAAQAASVQYDVTTGTVDISVLVAGTVIGTASGTVSGSLTIDHAAQSLDGLDLQLSPNILIAFTQSYGGFDLVNIENATIASDTPFSSTLVSSTAQSFTVIGTPLVVNGAYGGADLVADNLGPVTNVPISFAVPSITAAIGTSSIAFTSFTLNSLNGADFGETDDLNVLAQINIDPTNLTPIPEPSTALLMSLGLGLLAASRRRTD